MHKTVGLSFSFALALCAGCGDSGTKDDAGAKVGTPACTTHHRKPLGSRTGSDRHAESSPAPRR